MNDWISLHALFELLLLAAVLGLLSLFALPERRR